MKTAVAGLAERYDLTPPQVSALYAIKQGGTTMGEVAQKLHCDASNATGIIDRLVTQRLVTRTESEQDRRVKTLQLTERGNKVINDIIAALPEALGCDKLTIQERNAVHAAINKLS
ncbi:MAG: MarR family transcriptional regulator [Candidatus Saccharimonadales bacterium]